MCLGVPGRIVELTPGEGMPMGVVEFDGVRQETCLAFVPEARVGDYVLVHVGFALTCLDEAEADATLATLRSLGESNAETATEPRT